MIYPTKEKAKKDLEEIMKQIEDEKNNHEESEAFNVVAFIDDCIMNHEIPNMTPGIAKLYREREMFLKEKER